MKIGIDIDDTLTNTKDEQLKYWKIYYNNFPNPRYKSELPNNINSFGDSYIDTFWDTYREILSFNCTFKKDASAILHKLKNDNHTLCIITSRPDEKYENLKKRLNDWFTKNNIPVDFIYSNIKDKATFAKENNIDLLIDDDIKHCNATIKKGIKAILFNKDDNYQNFQTTSWQEVYNYIKKEE